ncbi:RHS repeat domain-containing protein [Brevundimonas sp. SL161]|uniref:RHS repeat domain-containing protein n=1 Tax=Brevundimonas sp. SL161 TaxID=2804613 RepID=UPI003CEA78B6
MLFRTTLWCENIAKVADCSTLGAHSFEAKGDRVQSSSLPSGMMNVSQGHGAALLVVCAMLVVSWTSAASAQSALVPPSPVEAVDQFGVELSSGSVQVSSPTISVGDPANGGLSFTANWDASVRDWRYSSWGAINKPVGSDPNCYNYLTLVYMGQSNLFQRDTCAGGYELIDGLGTLTEASGTWTYTAPDASVAVYQGTSRVVVNGALVDQTRIQTITRPNGEIISYALGGVSPASVTNNYGYQIHFDYTGGSLYKVTALNNAVDPCAPTAAICSFTQTWPSLTFTTAASGLERHVTDSLNRTTRIIFDSADPLLANVVGVAPPTTTSGSSVTYVNERIFPFGLRVTGASDGAGTWTYAYQPRPCGFTPSPDPADCPPPGYDYDLTTTITSPPVAPSTPRATKVYKFNWYERPFSNGHMMSELVSVTNALSQTTGVGITGAGFQGATYPDNNGVTITRNYLTGVVESVTEFGKSGPSGPLAVTEYTYPACTSNPVACRRATVVTNPRLNATTYTYDAAGNVLTATSPVPVAGAVRPQTRFSYQQQNAWYHQNGSTSITQNPNPIWVQVTQSQCATLAGQTGSTPAACIGTADEIRTTATYQIGSSTAASNLLPVSMSTQAGDNSLVATVTTTYDPVGNPLTVDGPLPGTADTTRHVYDAMRQQVGVIGPDPDAGGARLFPASRTTYNPDGQVTVVERGTTLGQSNLDWAAFSALQTSTSSYNGQGRLFREQLAPGTPAASLTDYAYDVMGRLTCTAQRMNPDNFASPPTNACAQTTVGRFGPDRISLNSYDLASRLIQVQTDYGTSAALPERVQGWTANGKVDWIEDGAGNRSDYVYDDMDRLYRLYFPVTTVGSHTANSVDFEEYGYDANDNPTTKRTRSGLLFTTAFDTLNRIASIDAPSGSNDVWYSYDNLGRRLSASHAPGAPGCSTTAVCSTWDGLSRQTTETTALGTMTSAWDIAGRRIELKWPDLFSVTYAYDLDDQMRSIRQAGVTTIVAYAYDDLGRRTAVGRGNAVSTTYGYDAASRLTSLSHDLGGTASDVTFSYGYTPASQIQTLGRSNATYFYSPPPVTVGYGVNGLNQSISAGGATLTWSAQGNLTGDGTRSYSYDAANRLTGMGSSTLTYDPLDRLAEMTGTLGARYQYDGVGVAAVYATGSGTISDRLIRGPWPDELAVSYAGTTAASPLWTLQDHQSSSIAITDPAGTAPYTLAYDDYGAPRPGNAGRFMYTGQMWMPDFAAYHYKARAYRPDLGRFLQTDPVGYGQGLNLYAYVGNDPVNGTDPDGRQIQGAACLAGAPFGGPVGCGVGVTVSTVATVAVGACTQSQSCRDKAGAVWDWLTAPLHNDADAPGEPRPAPPANDGVSRPHGAPDHDQAIDDRADEVRGQGADDIRKNQTQVDAQGNRVGDNRPDLGYTDSNGVRHNEEGGAIKVEWKPKGIAPGRTILAA